MKIILNTISVPAYAVFVTFLITLGLFPAIAPASIESAKFCDSDATRFNNDLFIPFMFFLFNLFDFAGRISAERYSFGMTAENIWIPATSRVVFFPLFFSCNITNTQLPVLFHNDAFPIIFLILFAYSNGLVATKAMMTGPSLLKERDMNLGGTVMLWFLTVGLGSGAALSFVSKLISQGSIQ